MYSLQKILSPIVSKQKSAENPSFIPSLPEFKKSFDTSLHEYLETKKVSLVQISEHDLTRVAITQAIAIIEQGGKRLRPYMVLLAAPHNDKTLSKELLQVGMALELLHAFALIHDDIIDHGTERHQQATVHTFLATKISNEPRGDKAHISNSLALLVGDIIFSWSYELIAKQSNEQVKKLFSSMVEEVMVGQMLDVNFMLRDKVNYKEIYLKNELKTARYSFVNPLLIGAAFDEERSDQALYTKLGLLLGQAFQIQDDLLDIVGDPHKTGKGNFSDIADGQHTILTQFVCEHSPLSRKTLQTFFGKALTLEDQTTLRELFQNTGAILFAESKAADLLREAEELIASQTLPETKQEKWNHILELLRHRTA